MVGRILRELANNEVDDESERESATGRGQRHPWQTSRHFAPQRKGARGARRASAERAQAHRASLGPRLFDLEEALLVDPATHAAEERAWAE